MSARKRANHLQYACCTECDWRNAQRQWIMLKWIACNLHANWKCTAQTNARISESARHFFELAVVWDFDREFGWRQLWHHRTNIHDLFAQLSMQTEIWCEISSQASSKLRKQSFTRLLCYFALTNVRIFDDNNSVKPSKVCSFATLHSEVDVTLFAF